METDNRQIHLPAPPALLLLQELTALYESRSFDDALHESLRILGHAVPCDRLDWYDFDAARRLRRFCNTAPAAAGAPPVADAARMQDVVSRHPVMRRVLCGDVRPVYRISDCIRAQSGSRHWLYRLLSRDYRAPYGLIVRLPLAGQGCLVVSVKRGGSDFGADDMAAAQAASSLIVRRLGEVAAVGAPCLQTDGEADTLRMIGSALGLSQREAQIAYWVFMAKSNKEIGAILGISHHTVRTHVQHIFDKKMLSTRFDLAHTVLRSLPQQALFADG